MVDDELSILTGGGPEEEPNGDPGAALLEGLTPPQREAVLQTEGPVLVLAAAGSGKTRVITRRIAYLISCGVQPWQVLALTFTNKAAGEMRERVFQLLGGGEDNRRTRGLTVTTFHSLCARLLRRYAEPAGLKPEFTIYDTGDQASLCKKVIEGLHLSTSNFPARSVLSAISNAKNALLDAAAFEARAFDFNTRNIAQIYKGYTRALRAANAVDFDDLLLLTAKLLQKNSEIREELRKRWQYLLIDEYQDTNHSQFVIASELAGDGKAASAEKPNGPNICVVGDPDQCLPRGTMISTPRGQRAIEKLKKGDLVTSSTGWGSVESMKINKVVEKSYRGSLVVIRTDDGHEVRATPNHVMFARLIADPTLRYTYLMWKRKIGYRIGTTRGVRASKQGDIVSGLQVRANQDVADAMWVLRTSRSPAEALFYEHFYSVKYGIPTMVFFVRGRRMKITQNWIDRLYTDIDTDEGAERLMAELHLDSRYPHHRPGAVTRTGAGGRKGWSRRHVMFTVFGDNRPHTLRPWHEHRIQMVTTDKALRRAATGQFPVRDGVRETWRIETSRKDYDEALDLARGIMSLDDEMEIVSRARLTKDKAFHFMPASHIHPGMQIPVLRDGEVVAQRVESVEWEEHRGVVFDLSVPNTRNYIAEGTVVHNSIYGWRGADIMNILEFEEHYPRCRVITLGENFRSMSPILSVADTLIRKNKQRKHKDLFTNKKGGDKITAVLCRDERHEAALVVDWFKALHDENLERRDEGTEARRHGGEDKGLAWREMAVFYRTNALSRVMEEAFRAAGIPYTIARGTAFYEREEVKSALAYLRLVANQADDVSLLRIVNTPARGIGDTSMTKVEEWAERNRVPVFEAMRHADEIGDLTGRAVGGIRKFVAMVDGWTGGGTFMGAATGSTLAELVDHVIRESGLQGMYKQQAATSQSETDRERLDNLDELVSSAREFEQEYDPANDPSNFDVTMMAAAGSDGPSPVSSETPPLLALLRAYLESISLVADADAVDPDQGSVTLMTLHAAKGLEFPAVAMVGLEEGMLPHARALSDESQMEEERRLCFVGITRAMRLLHMTAAKYRTVRGVPERTIPSRFLSEIGKEHVTFSDQSDQFADLDDTQWGRDTGKYDTSRAELKSGPSIGTRIAQAFPTGSLVRHPQFGVGKVLAITGGVNARATIQFKDVGTKTLVLEYARLTRV